MILGLSNVKSYVCSVVMSCICFFVLFAALQAAFFQRLNRKYRKFVDVGQFLNYHSTTVIIPAFIVVFAIAAYILDYNTKEMLGRYIFISQEVFIIAAVLTIVLFFLLRKKNIHFQWKFVRKCLECLSIIICGWGGYKPNVLYDTFNYNAYWLNVVQIYHHIPYDKAKLSFYGHYSLLMLPYFKIAGLSAVTVAILQSVENIVICIAIIYSVKKITDKESIRICGVIAVSYFVGASACHYPQGFPHRLVFMALLLALGCKASYSEKRTKWLTITFRRFE